MSALLRACHLLFVHFSCAKFPYKKNLCAVKTVAQDRFQSFFVYCVVYRTRKSRGVPQKFFFVVFMTEFQINIKAAYTARLIIILIPIIITDHPVYI